MGGFDAGEPCLCAASSVRKWWDGRELAAGAQVSTRRGMISLLPPFFELTTEPGLSSTRLLRFYSKISSIVFQLQLVARREQLLPSPRPCWKPGVPNRGPHTPRSASPRHRPNERRGWVYSVGFPIAGYQRTNQRVIAEPDWPRDVDNGACSGDRPITSLIPGFLSLVKSHPRKNVSKGFGNHVPSSRARYFAVLGVVGTLPYL